VEFCKFADSGGQAVEGDFYKNQRGEFLGYGECGKEAFSHSIVYRSGENLSL
jgi:hypothetical protein